MTETSRPTDPQPEAANAAPERVQKFLSRAGIASRRAAEELIIAGRVSVNGEPVTSLATKVTEGVDEVCVDGRLVEPPAQLWYLMLNKPVGVVTTLDDPQGRPTVARFIPEGAPRLFPVGRLDFATTGLLLLTNDGAFAHLLMHPRHHVTKVYRANVDGVPDRADLEALEEGVLLDDGRTAPARARVVTQRGEASVVELTIHEGRKRQVRRMMSAIGHPVRALTRVAYGPLTLGELAEGSVRLLDDAEVQALRDSAREVD